MFGFIFIMSYAQTSGTAAEAIDIGLKSHPNWNLLPHDTCGQRALDERTQNLLSNTTYFGKYPWMVFLFDNNDNKLKTNLHVEEPSLTINM